MPLRRDRAWFALSVLLAVARLGRQGGSVSASTVAREVRATPRTLEPLLQRLARAGLLSAQRGPRGGYGLGAGGTAVSLASVVAALADEGGTPHAPEDAVTRLRAELEWETRRRLAALTLGDLLRRDEAASVIERSSNCNRSDTVPR